MPDPTATQITALIGGQERLSGEIEALRTDIQALTQGLILMVESQGAQTEMLQQVLELAAPEPSAENPMETLLGRLTGALDKQAAELGALKHAVNGFGQRIAGAIIRGAGPAQMAAAVLEAAY